MARRYHPEEEERRRKRRVLLFSFIMIGLMIFSIVEVILYRGTLGGEQMEYAGYEFTYKQYAEGLSVLVTHVNGQEVEFQSLPPLVTYLDADPAALELIKNSQQLLLTSDMALEPQDAMTLDYARLQLGLSIPNTINAQATPNETFSLPVVNCSVATPQMVVVLFNLSNETSLRAEGACVILNAAQGDVLRMKDRIIYEYLGILKDGMVVD